MYSYDRRPEEIHEYNARFQSPYGFKIYDIRNCKNPIVDQPNRRNIEHVYWSPNGKFIYAEAPGEHFFWNVEDQKVRFTFLCRTDFEVPGSLNGFYLPCQ